MQQSNRKMFSRAEWMILAGLCACVFSAILVWGTSQPRATDNSHVNALFVKMWAVQVSGYDLKLGWLSVGWAVVACAVGAGALLLIDPGPKNRGVLFIVHTALAGIVIALAVLHLGPLPGVILALVGSVVLMIGGIMRYRHAEGVL